MRGVSIQFVAVAVILGLLSTAIYFWVPAIKITPAYPFILLFLFLVTYFIFAAQQKSLDKRTSQFANIIMLTNFGKLIFYSIIVFVYAWLNRQDAVPFILTFFVYYFAFTFVEVIGLLRLGSKS